MIESESESMERIGNLISIVDQLRQIRAHLLQLKQANKKGNAERAQDRQSPKNKRGRERPR